jgi:hypothetical protein
MYSLTEIKNSWNIDKKNTISFLNSILENDTYKIILSIIEHSKTVKLYILGYPNYN